MPNDPKPPAGYETWWDYAIATMDTRTLYLECIDNGGSFQRDDFTEAARAELDILRADAEAYRLLKKRNELRKE